MGTFELWKTKKGRKTRWHWHLKAGNGEIIAASEEYNSKQGAMNGIRSTRFNSILPRRFEHFIDKSGERRWNLKARNGKVLAISEGYSHESSAKQGMWSVMKNAPFAKFKEINKK